MELLQHLGLWERKDLDIAAFKNLSKAIVKITILLYYLILYHVVSVTSHFVMPFFPESVSRIKRGASILFWDLCFYFLKSNLTFEISGDPVDSESAVVVCNHQSLADYFAISNLAKQSSLPSIMLPRVNFFTWISLWRVPTIRVMINLARSDENWELEDSLCKLMFKPILESNHPEWIALFPEVNICTQEINLLHNMQSQKYFLPVFENVLYPRFSGFYNVIFTLQSSPRTFTRLYDVTVWYTREKKMGSDELIDLKEQFRPPTLLECFASKSKITVQIHVKSKLLSSIPVKRSKIEKWLEKSWVDKDQRLSNEKLHKISESMNKEFQHKDHVSIVTPLE